MKPTLILADSASPNPDGTYSLLRGGLNEVRIPSGAPIIFHGSLLARLEATPEEKGTYEVSITFRSDNGEPIGKEPKMKFEVGAVRPSVLNIVMDMRMKLPKLGRYEISMIVGDKKVDSLSLTAIAVNLKVGK